MATLPSWKDGAVRATLRRLLASRLRQAWPKVKLIVRGDSGFCRSKALRRFEAWGIDYIIGLQKNVALEWRSAIAMHALADQYEAAGTRQRLIDEFACAARSWARERRVIARLEHGPQGPNPRFAGVRLQSGTCLLQIGDLRERNPTSIQQSLD